MQDADVTKTDALPNKVRINLHMFGTLMLDGVRRHVDSTDVVAVYQSCTAQRRVELRQQLAQPGGLSHGIGHHTVLGFSTGPGDCVLPLRGPGNKIIPKENGIARGGLARIRTTSLVSIRLNHQVTL